MIRCDGINSDTKGQKGQAGLVLRDEGRRRAKPGETRVKVDPSKMCQFSKHVPTEA